MTIVPIFVDLQGFIVNEKFKTKEIAILKHGHVLTHHIFRAPLPWNRLTTSEKARIYWLINNHHQLRWSDGYVNYTLTEELVRHAVCAESFEPNDCIIRVYVKGHEKKIWLTEILGDDVVTDYNLAIENIEDDYEDIGRLETLNVSRAIARCGYHAKNCAMENVFKLYYWWRERYNHLENF